MKEKLCIAMAQQNPITGAIETNLALAKKLILEAEAAKADIILFSELFLCGYPAEDLLLKPAFLYECNQALENLIKFSQKLNIAVIIGAPDVIEQKRYNAVFFIAKGEILGKSHKKDLPNYAEFDEKRIFCSGSQKQIITYKGIKIALPICEDIWNMPQFSKGDSDLVLIANASPYRIGKLGERKAKIRCLARQAGCPVFYVNQIGGQDELVFDGASMVCNAMGEIVAQFPQFEEHLDYMRLNYGYIDKLEGLGHEASMCCKDKTEFTVVNEAYRAFYLEAEQEKIISYTDLEADYRATILGLKDYVHKNGFTHCLLGLSGGIDSALCAAMICDAIGAANLRCIMLPYKYTSEQSLNDAKKCAQLLGCAYEIIDIEKAVSALASILPIKHDQDNLWFENLQSRIRGTILMALSNKSNALLITTGNKSELATGYATIYGDMNGAFNPLKDIYKTRIYALAKWRNKKSLVIPESIITKPASAELRENQKDEDNLAPYDVLDKILYELIENDSSIKEIVAKGYDKMLVKKIENLLYRAEYKRFQAAPGVRLSGKNLGTDRRYPITNHYRDKS